MTQSGGTHGQWRDDALKRAVEDEMRAGHATRADEWREPEPPADDEPEATWAPQGRPGDLDSLELRSDLARHLDRATFPADRDHLLDTLAAHKAPPSLMDLAAQLPEGTKFRHFGDVARALGLPAEERGT
jgi:hypothetical protein